MVARLYLGGPEAIQKIFVQKSGCLSLVNCGRAMASRAMERAIAAQGKLQDGSNLGKGQIKAADYFLQPDIVSSNRNSGGSAVGGMLGGINVKKREVNVTISVVDTRTTEEKALIEGSARKSDLSFGGGGGYQDTAIGQAIVLAYLDAYTKLVGQLGGLPDNAADAAPLAK